MLNQTKTRLQIFDDESRNYKFEIMDSNDSPVQPVTFINNTISGQIFTTDGQAWIDYPKRRKSFKFPKLKFEHVLNPIKFFKDVKSNMTPINEEELQLELRALNNIMKEVETIKQQALLQQLKKEKERIRSELILSHLDYKYLDEEDMNVIIEELNEALAA